MGQGPPYEEAHDLVKDIPKAVWSGPRFIADRIHEIRVGVDGETKTSLTSTEQALYAFGLLSMEGDLKKLQPEEK